ncbi:protein NRT1/ PTR FAMILY 8.3-like isoform X2 [Ananas comosus]|uniref:Protein NRT1/ PTR FAMILY 8.3-like isoform X2 n=1 Tax=Ananas comosus TaxID=4615 RepID=A0A6P5FNR4_ANACO|nr:protein NRT1/ PTR FAMILY 8.3-like isoform X2 [Ananas comosus]
MINLAFYVRGDKYRLLYLLKYMKLLRNKFLSLNQQGMILVTLSALTSASIKESNATQNVIFFSGLYLLAIGCGGVRSALLPFGADQFDDRNLIDRERKRSFFSWFYLCVNFGVIISGIFIVWIQENIGWALGFGIATLCITLAFVGYLLGTPIYRIRSSHGSPLESIFQVLIASFRKIRLEVPKDSGLLYEADSKRSNDSEQTKLAHTDDFRFLDKAAIVTDSDLDQNGAQNEWNICTVTQVEELKILLRLVPIWLTSIVYAAAHSQMFTTFIQQGTSMDTNIKHFSIPPASLNSFEVLAVMLWVILYNKIVAPATQSCFSNGAGLSQLQRMGIGRFLGIVAMAIAAYLEARRLEIFRRGEILSILWQLPQYFILAGSEMFSLITQLEFFYGQAPDSMKSTCTAFALLTISLGHYLSSMIIAVVAALTTAGGRPGWIPDDLNKGHLDYYFWVLTILCLVNFVVYLFFAQKFTLKKVIN